MIHNKQNENNEINFSNSFYSVANRVRFGAIEN